MFCNGQHGGTSCKIVEDPDECKKLVAKQGLCFMCLYKGHRAFGCRFKSVCKLFKRVKHHVSLCSGSNNAKSAVDASLLAPNTPQLNLANATSCVEGTGYVGRGILLTGQANDLRDRNSKMRILALMHFRTLHQLEGLPHNLNIIQ